MHRPEGFFQALQALRRASDTIQIATA